MLIYSQKFILYDYIYKMGKPKYRKKLMFELPVQIYFLNFFYSCLQPIRFILLFFQEDNILTENPQEPLQREQFTLEDQDRKPVQYLTTSVFKQPSYQEQSHHGQTNGNSQIVY